MRSGITFSIIVIVAFCTPALAYDWSTNPGNGLPENPYQISEPNHLMAIGSDANLLDKHFILTNDIVFDPDNNPNHVFTQALIAPDISSSFGFQGAVFAGVFNGDGHSLLNLKIDSSVADYVGLFGSIDSGVVKYLRLENATVTGDRSVGGLVGKNSGVITNCGVAGNVNGDGDVGGVCGENSGTLVNCFYMGGTVSGDHTTGGLIARNFGAARSSYAIGSIQGRAFVGGLTGIAWGLVEQCFADCIVSGDSYVGGLSGAAGEISVALLNCYAMGRVEGTDFTGGLVGKLHGATPVAINCYSAVQVIPPDGCNEDPQCRVGGFVGNIEFIPEPDSCFWDTETSGLSDGVGTPDPDPAGVMGRTTVGMQTLSTFTSEGWDFLGESANGDNEIWRMCADGVDYPRLSWEFSQNGDFACGDGVDLADLQALTLNWLTLESDAPLLFNHACDANGDGQIDLKDYSVLSGNW